MLAIKNRYNKNRYNLDRHTNALQSLDYNRENKSISSSTNASLKNAKHKKRAFKKHNRRHSPNKSVAITSTKNRVSNTPSVLKQSSLNKQIHKERNVPYSSDKAIMMVYPPSPIMIHKLKNRPMLDHMNRFLIDAKVKKAGERFTFDLREISKYVTNAKQGVIYTFCKDSDTAICYSVSKLKNITLPKIFKESMDRNFALVLFDNDTASQNNFMITIIPIVINKMENRYLPPTDVPIALKNIKRIPPHSQRIQNSLIARCAFTRGVSPLRVGEPVCRISEQALNAIKSTLAYMTAYTALPRTLLKNGIPFENSQGDIYWGNYNYNKIGAEICKPRPVVIVSSNQYNRSYNYTVLVIPLTRTYRPERMRLTAEQIKPFYYGKGTPVKYSVPVSYLLTNSMQYMLKGSQEQRIYKKIGTIVDPAFMMNLVSNVQEYCSMKNTNGTIA